MTISEIKDICIREYLKSINCDLKKDYKYYGMYCSPYRDDPKASLKVDYSRNVWYDHGEAKGGSIIDLVMKVEQLSFLESVKYLQNQKFPNTSFSFHCLPDIRRSKSIAVVKVSPLKNKGLLLYLESRKINMSIALDYCKEIHFIAKSKFYYAVGFENNKGGYELRNKYFKGCLNKDLTTFNNNTDTLLVFEGFMDFLSYLCLSLDKNRDFVILNSVTNVIKLKCILPKYKNVELFLDNDATGEKYTKLLLEEFSNVEDHSNLYSDCKDLNEYLMTKV